MGSLTDIADQIEGRTPAQQIMVEDGLPPVAVMAPEERREAWKGREPKHQERTTVMPKTNTKADQVAALRTKRAAEKGPKASRRASASKKAAKAKARTPAAPRTAPAPGNGPRPGSKVALVAGLLTRKQGCTAADVKEACDWVAVSMPAQAKAAGLTLRQEKIDGATRYYGTAG